MKVIPAKFTITKEVQELFENAFIKGQKEKWEKVAEEAASSFTSFTIPENLPQEVKENAQKTYDIRFKLEKKTAYEEGYASAFYDERLTLTNKYEQVPLMKELFEKGFHDNTEISTYPAPAYNIFNPNCFPILSLKSLVFMRGFCVRQATSI
ncbi:hypothetical protein E2R56_26290 [Rhodococcus qingshengii]|nr:hypothetical protein E2R56_26290 [Rhodococcus qingshengii]